MAALPAGLHQHHPYLSLLVESLASMLCSPTGSSMSGSRDMASQCSSSWLRALSAMLYPALQMVWSKAKQQASMQCEDSALQQHMPWNVP